MSLPITAAALGLLIAGGILYLVRRDHLHGSHAVWWLLVAAVALLFGFFPRLVDVLGTALGVKYPPMLLVILGLIALLLKLVQMDIDLSRRERRLRRLTQKVALLEYELHQRGLADTANPPTGDAPSAARPLVTSSKRRRAG